MHSDILDFGGKCRALKDKTLLFYLSVHILYIQNMISATSIVINSIFTY